MFIKQKASGLVTARLAIDGSHQPPDSYTNTFAGTSDVTNRSFIIAVTLADAAHRNILPELVIGSYDITAAFLQSSLPRSQTGGYQLLTILPKDLPDPTLAGKTAEIIGACYGLKQANHVFDTELTALHTAAGFHPTNSDHHTYRKVCAVNPSNSLTINLHVDDGFYLSTSPSLLIEYKALLTDRYGPIAFNDHCTSICGITVTRHTDHSITLDYGAHLKTFLTKAGMDPLPPALSPSLPTLFHAPTDRTPVNQTAFQRINGSLLFYVPLRNDCRKEIVHLCTKNANPTATDRADQIQLLRYLKGNPTLGPTFTAIPSNHPSGVTLIASADASHACHSDASSHAAYTLSIGTNTAPFLAYSAREKDISLNPCETEYKTLTKCAKDVVFFRQFAADLGHPQSAPTIILEDNKSAIKLAIAPAVTRKSRHIFIKHHYIRWLCQQNHITLQHQGTHDIVADGLTKYTPPSAFPYFRARLLNLFHPSDVKPQPLHTPNISLQ
jgi:Reverse transcriptase (RNA-dependent DNA polymerase)